MQHVGKEGAFIFYCVENGGRGGRGGGDISLSHVAVLQLV